MFYYELEQIETRIVTKRRYPRHQRSDTLAYWSEPQDDDSAGKLPPIATDHYRYHGYEREVARPVGQRAKVKIKPVS